jgi:hypothetical protein
MSAKFGSNDKETVIKEKAMLDSTVVKATTFLKLKSRQGVGAAQRDVVKALVPLVKMNECSHSHIRTNGHYQGKVAAVVKMSKCSHSHMRGMDTEAIGRSGSFSPACCASMATFALATAASGSVPTAAAHFPSIVAVFGLASVCAHACAERESHRKRQEGPPKGKGEPFHRDVQG